MTFLSGGYRGLRVDAGSARWLISSRARAELHLARGEPGAAAVVLERRLRQVSRQSLLAVTVLDLLVQARLAEGDLDAADEAALALEAMNASAEIDRATRTPSERGAGWRWCTQDARARTRVTCVDNRVGLRAYACRRLSAPRSPR